MVPRVATPISYMPNVNLDPVIVGPRSPIDAPTLPRREIHVQRVRRSKKGSCSELSVAQVFCATHHALLTKNLLKRIVATTTMYRNASNSARSIIATFEVFARHRWGAQRHVDAASPVQSPCGRISTAILHAKPTQIRSYSIIGIYTASNHLQIN